MQRRRGDFTKSIEGSKYLQKVLESSREGIMLACSNNCYLLEGIGKSVYWQLKYFAALGHGFCNSTYSHLKSGDAATCSSFRMSILAQFWGLRMGDMMVRDLRAEGYKLPADWVPPSERPEFK